VSPRRYFAAFALSALAAAVAVVGVNCLIDPLGVVPGSPSVRGVNAEKVIRFNNDRITVAHTLAPNASRFEVWFRIVRDHSTVRPVGGRIYFNATVDLSPAAPGT